MTTKSLLCASASAIIVLAIAPANAQTAREDSAQGNAAPARPVTPRPAKPAQTARDRAADVRAPMPEAASDRSINPASPQTTVPAAPTADADIVVTGLRRSLESAQAIKRSSDGIVDAIVAEDIGKLPDTFASSALARVSGVQVNRGGGEAAGVTVRGLPDISTTYNGREIFTAEGRFVQIQDFPAGTVAALEVYKSGTANLIEGGIGGQVNVRGRKPFDFKGFEMSGSLNGVAWQQSDGLTWNGNLLVSNRWDTGIGEIGVLVNASYVGLKFLDSTREQSLVIGTTDPVNAPGTTGGVRYPDAQALFLGYGNRWRPSANAAVQWRPSPELEFYVDGLFQGYRGQDYNRFMFVPIFGGDMRLTDLRTRSDNPRQAQSATVTNAFRPDGFFGSFDGKTDTYQVGGGGIWQRDGLRVSTDVAYTDSKFMLNGVNIDYAFASSPVRNVVFETGRDGGPSVNFGSFDVTNPANFISRGLFQELLMVGGKDVQARSDVSYDLDMGFLKRIQVGVRYGDRDANRDRGAPYIYNEPARVPLASLGLPVTSGIPGFAYDDSFPVRTFASIPRDAIRGNLPQLRSAYGAPAGLPAFNPTENFRANEKSYAAYAQVKYGFDIGAVTVDGLVGLRAIKTKTTISGFTRTFDAQNRETIAPITARNEYTDYLPNASARVGLSSELQLRLAYTQTRTRPNFFSLNPTLTIGNPVVLPPECAATPTLQQCNVRRGVGGGNPDLKPLTSDNYDASLEWYFARAGSLTGAIFRRDASGFIYNNITNPTDPVLGPIRLDIPLNSGNTRFQGAEVAFSSFLDIDGLPAWAKGFGLQANATYIDSKGDLSPDFNRLLGNRQVAFNGVSKWTYNVVGLYERPFFSARLAYNYRSNFVTYYSAEPLDVGPGLLNPAETTGRVRGLVERGRGQLDFSTTVTPVPNVTIAFDIVNLLGNPLRRYRPFNDAGDTFARQIIYLERTYSLGVRFRF